jgi:hypothetical protein
MKRKNQILLKQLTNKYMKTNYLPGIYYIKYRGRGVIKVELTSGQAKVLFDLLGKLEIEKITHEKYKI